MGPHILVIVRVVNRVRFDASCSPTECRMTLRAPHLITAVDFENARCTVGAVARVACEHLGRRHIVWVACMFSVLFLAFDFMALGTRPVVTHPALPRGAQKALAILKRARTDKLASLRL